MNDTPVNRSFREQAARWLHRVMEGSGLRDADVLKASGIAKSTFYRLKQGEGEPDQETLEAIAKAIGVPAPQIGKVLLYEAPEATGPLGMVREARAMLQRAELLFEELEGGSERAPPALRVAEGQGVYVVKRAIKRVEAAATSADPELQPLVDAAVAPPVVPKPAASRQASGSGPRKRH